MNAWNKRGSNSKNFGISITEIGVTVEKICLKEVSGTYLKFWKVSRVNLGKHFQIPGPFWNIEDNGLILDKDKGPFVKLARVLSFGFIFE
jgi:hypothetical protein